MPGRMYVVKRNNEIEDVHFDKITRRIAKMCDMEPKLNADFVDPVRVSQKVVAGLFPGVTTGQLDNLAAETAASMMSYHPDYSVLAARMAISNLQKETCEKFSEVMGSLFSWTNPSTGKHSPLISYGTWDIIRENSEFLDSAIDNARDFSYSYFGFKTLERSYLLKLGYEVPSAPSSKDGAPDSNKQKQKMVVKYKVAERPQHMLMRVAVGIHGKDLDAAIETYNLMSKKLFTHASPTLFNAGTGRPQLSSCFLLTMQSDSIEGIYDTLRQCALISKSAGGIGLNVHNIRSSGSFIAGTNGTSNGLMPMLRVFNSTARYVDQGGNKRPGAFAIYLEPWHADIRDFLNARKNHGAEEQRARDLFYALWIPDLFMRRVLDDEKWSLMCPDECPNLHEVWGEEFEKLYMQYESEGRYREQISARRLFEMITQSQIETGTPYMLYKDACNRKSNQQNLGTIKCSNLCTEIVEFSSKDEVAVCNLASIAVNMYVDVEKKVYDYQRLYEVTKVATRNLNKIIEVNFYPIEETRRSNMRHRPIGIGVQGLADAFILMRFPFTSPEAKRLNKNIFETLYYASLEASCELAEEHGPYSTYEGSPVSKGILQFDMWDVKPDSGLWDWNALRARIKKHGVRNSLLLAPMPTASTAQILGNNESTEPYTSNLYARRVLSGEFIVANQHLLRDLVKLNLWSPDMKNMLMHTNGSIQTIEDIPQDIKDLYKTVWELPQRDIIDMAADRGPYIDQSQSLNVHIAEPSMAKLQSMHFYGWRKGLKTGMYYLRTKPATSAIKFTVDKMKLMSVRSNSVTSQDSLSQASSKIAESDKENDEPVVFEKNKKAMEVSEEQMQCMLDNPDSCLMCSG